MDLDQPRSKSPLELDKLALYTKPASPEDKTAKLIWSVVFNNPRITVYTNKKEAMNKDNDWGRIIARLDIMVAFSIIEALKAIGDKENGERVVIKNMNYPIVNNTRSDTAMHVNDIIVGKDKEGIVWLSVIQEGKPNIKFNIGLSDYHEFYHGDGSAYTPSEVSILATKAYTNILEKMMANSYYLPDQLAILNTSPDDKKNMYNTKGTYKKNPNIKKEENEPALAFNDDLPF